MARKFPANDITQTVVKKLVPPTPEDWAIMLRLGVVGRRAFMEDWEARHSNHDYGVMLYREFGLDYREETS